MSAIFLDFRLRKFAVDAIDERTQLARIDEKSFAFLILIAADEPKRGGDGHAVKEIGRHSDDAFDKVRLDNLPADFTFAAALRRERAVGEHHTDFSVRREVVNHVLQPSKIGVPVGRKAVFPAYVIPKRAVVPIGEIEGRIGEDGVGLERQVEVVREGVRIVGAKIRLDAANGQIHDGEFAGGRVRLLPVDGDGPTPAAVFAHKLLGLHEHPHDRPRR